MKRLSSTRYTDRRHQNQSRPPPSPRASDLAPRCDPECFDRNPFQGLVISEQQ